MNQKVERIHIRVDAEFLQLIDEWRRQQPDLPNRSEAIRRMCEIAAGNAKPNARPRP
jgi:metal-responsive CopG/Arc/MetJ family transcriptional regulator